jgi:hypothetical protein
MFWALVLVGIGSLLLARNLGYTIPVWQTLVVYWPVLVIGWGLIKVVDYFRLRDERDSVFSAGEVALLVFVLIVGTAFTTAANVSSDPGFLGLIGEELDLFDILGESHLFTSEIRTSIASGRTIEIHNAYGTVDIEPGAAGVLVVSIEKSIRAASREAAAELEQDLMFAITDDPDRTVVDSNRNSLRDRVRRRFRTNLRIQVPTDAAVELDNSYGPVRITGLTGDQSVVNRYGGVTVDQIDGSVRVQDRYGPVSIRQVSGSANVSNSYGPVDLEMIGGDAAVENRYARVDINGVQGRTEVSNRYSQVAVRDASGDVRVTGRNNLVELENVAGAVDVDTSYRRVDGRNLRGRVQVSVRHGDVVLGFDEPPDAAVDVTGDYSNVRVEMPAASEFSLEAQTRSGSFDSEFEGFERESLGRNLRVTGSRGTAGPRITINTARGDIRLAVED